MNLLVDFSKDLLVVKLIQDVKMKNDKLIHKDKGFSDDSIVGIIHLIHGQIHSELQYMQSKDENWIKISEEARKDRTELLDLIVEGSGELWCFSKHCLAWIGIYCELGSRCASANNQKLAKHYYSKAEKWLSVFYKINNLREEK